MAERDRERPGGRSGVVMLFVAGLVAGSVLAVTGVQAYDALSAEETVTAMAPPRFVEEAAAAGIDHAYDGGFTFFVGGGVADFDCDDDGRPDLYLAGGENPAALYRNESPIGGALRFEQVPDPATDLTEVVGAYPLDVDGDGTLDLAVLRVGENVLLRGLGDCRFERANAAWGFDGGDEWTAGFSATWERDAAMPTLAIGNYLDLEGIHQRATCADSELVRPDPGGTTYASPIPLTPGWCTLSVLFSDWSRTGARDLRMANDRHYYTDGQEQLWHIDAGQPPRMYTAEEGWQRLVIWGMGIAEYDLTGDGLPEVFLTSQGDNRLQTLADGATGPTYEDIALERGVTAHRPYTGGD
ncbi:MAG TPA: VCBS repeat-containing protein, partial [Actinomycetota bacterium]|nr:VCBS repeat-containing protein [Actinomycetota bacterium]